MIDAAWVKDKLHGRHPGAGGKFPGPWTVIEEWRGIDLLAFSAWSSASRFARVGYEVKVSRSDLRNELLRPYKRLKNVDWCNEFYFALPHGLLKDDELDYVEPEWAPEDWRGEPCPGLGGIPCRPRYRAKTHYVEVPKPTTRTWDRHERIVCPTCGGRGTLTRSRVELEAPTCWIPRDVGLITVTDSGCRVVKPSPRRKEVPTLGPSELGQLVRWVSMRPDRRHQPRQAAAA